MADNTLVSFNDFLLVKQGQVNEVFSSEAVLLAEMSGYSSNLQKVDPASPVQRITREMEGNRDTFSGDFVKHVIIKTGLQGGGQVQEASTWNVPYALPTTQVHIKLVRTLFPITLTVDVERDSMDNSMASAVETIIDQTRSACARLENLQMCGDGTGLVAMCTDGATSLTTTVLTGTPLPNWDVILPGTIWDLLTATTGADPGQGLRRKIASLVESTGVITWDTAQQDTSVGGSGNIVHSSTTGIYIPGSWSNGTAGTATAPGALCAQGIEQAIASTGTFESLDKAGAGNSFWWGTDGRSGVTTELPLSTQILDGAIRKGRRAGLGKWDFAYGNPAVIDLYKQTLYASVRYDSQNTFLKSGFPGIVYDGGDAPLVLVKEPMAPRKGLRMIDKASFQLYGDAVGPQFLQDDGGMFRRFARTLSKEADFLDRWQFGVKRTNTIVYCNNLAEAA